MFKKEKNNFEMLICSIYFNTARSSPKVFLIERFSAGEPMDKVKGPFWLIIGNHMTCVPYQNLGEIRNLFDVPGQLSAYIPLGALGTSVIMMAIPLQALQEALR